MDVVATAAGLACGLLGRSGEFGMARTSNSADTAKPSSSQPRASQFRVVSRGYLSAKCLSRVTISRPFGSFQILNC